MSLNKLCHFLISLLCVLAIVACDSNTESLAPKEEVQQQEDLFEVAMNEKNAELEHVQIELTTYADDVDATLTQPSESNFAVNEDLTIEGTVNHHEHLKGNYARIKIYYQGESLTDNTQLYYAPINEGTFSQHVTLGNGKGEYSVTVLLPSMDQDNYYYDIAKFDVFNVNTTIHHDMTYSSFAQDVELMIQDPDNAYIEANESFTLTGEINLDDDQDTVMIELLKDGEMWKHVLPVKDGKFTYNVPLFYGKGIHELKVYVPDLKKDNYYQEATVLYINNASDHVTEPITYWTIYDERGVNLEFPTHGGDETELTYSIKGSIDKEAPFAEETTHLYITTKKDGEEALAIIPVSDYTFDGEFYLKFGPGTYDVIVSVPEIREKSDTFYYKYVAQFSLTNKADGDQRDTLPSRGVEPDAPEIKSLAKEVMNDSMSDREKAKAVYEYTAKNILYDVPKLRNNNFNWDDSALKTLHTGTGVCQDYTYLALALLRANGMEARYVAGTVKLANHAWVEVKVDGEWLTMDPTWGAGYIDQDKFIPKYTDVYFEPDDEVFKNHSRTGIEY